MLCLKHLEFILGLPNWVVFIVYGKGCWLKINTDKCSEMGNLTSNHCLSNALLFYLYPPLSLHSPPPLPGIPPPLTLYSSTYIRTLKFI